MSKKKWYLGYSDDYGHLYLEDFSWDCNWYWSGGYVGNRNVHMHFNGLGDSTKNMNMYDRFIEFFTDSPLTDDELWRLCDLFKQFYAYKEAAECFKYGGHYTNKGRTYEELRPDMNKTLNEHIENVIIPEIRKLMDEVSKRGKK